MPTYLVNPDHVVVDVEIKKNIDEVPNGWNDTHLLGVSCACVWEYRHDRMRVYGDTPEELDALRGRLIEAHRVTSFNGWAFDFPVIWGQPRGMHVAALYGSSDDLLARIWQAMIPAVSRKGWSLDAIALGTLGRGKTGNGAMAPVLYQAGRWGELVDYCSNDVGVTRDLSDHVDRNGYVFNGPFGLMLKLAPWAPPV